MCEDWTPQKISCYNCGILSLCLVYPVRDAVCIAFWGDFGVCENTALHLFGYTHWQVCAICSTCHVPCRVSKCRINWCSFTKSLLLLDLDVAPVDDYCSWYSCFQPTLGWVCSDCPPWREWTSEVLHPPRWIMWYGGFHSHSLFMYIYYYYFVHFPFSFHSLLVWYTWVPTLLQSCCLSTPFPPWTLARTLVWTMEPFPSRWVSVGIIATPIASHLQLCLRVNCKWLCNETSYMYIYTIAANLIVT